MKTHEKIISDLNSIFKIDREYGSTTFVLLFSFVLLFCTSCLKEENCPQTYSVTLRVEDKNYSNIRDIPELVAINEQLPFKSYVSNLSYHLIDLKTQTSIQVVPQYSVTNNDTFQTLDFSGIKSGRYILSVFGNITQPIIRNDVLLTYNLHQREEENQDTYLAVDTLTLLPGSTNLNLGMKRTKGLLYIIMENLPDSITRIDEQIFAISQDIDRNFTYSHETTVKKSTTGDLQPTTPLSVLLSPTPPGKRSTIRLSLFSRGASTPFMYIPDFTTIIKRNEVTIFKINFKPEGGLEILTATEGNWIKIHDIDIMIQ